VDLAILRIDVFIRVRCTAKRDYWKAATAELRSLEELKRLLNRVGKGDVAEDVAGEVVHWGADTVKGVEIDETIIEEFGFRISPDR
jgi:hypothetical protein